MASDIDIINSGLSKLGERVLTARSDNSTPGRLANRTYNDIRDSLLREFPWNFAIKRASLAASATAPEWGYDRAFPLPSDCLRLVEINNDNRYEWRNEGGSIVTDLEAPLKIIYVAQVAENDMDPTFREALAARLAMEWAEPLSQTASVIELMSGLYRNKLQVARSVDGQGDDLRKIEGMSFIEARY